MTKKHHPEDITTENSYSNKTCFAIMPISDPENYEQGHFRRVYENLISPAIREAGFEPFRADDNHGTNLIHVEILKDLINSPLAICDLSSRNPNVLFELGIRQAFDKPVVIIQEKGTPAIFDIATIRTINYDRQMRYDNVLNAQEQITKAIQETMSSSPQKGINSIIKLMSIAEPAQITQVSKDEVENIELMMIRNQIQELSSLIKYNLNSRHLILESKYSKEVSSINNEKYNYLHSKVNRLLENSANLSKDEIALEAHMINKEIIDNISMCKSTHDRNELTFLRNKIKQYF
jgi:hypothetical protein